MSPPADLISTRVLSVRLILQYRTTTSPPSLDYHSLQVVTSFSANIYHPTSPHTLSPLEMAPLTTSSRTLLSACSRHPLRCLSPALSAQQRRGKADIVQRIAGEHDRTSKFESPFKSIDENPTTKVPDFKKYMSKSSDTSNKTFQYFMVGSMGLLAAAGAKATVQGELEGDELAILVYEKEWSVRRGGSMANDAPASRFPSQHGRIRRRARTSQGRDRSSCHSRGKKRTFSSSRPSFNCGI